VVVVRARGTGTDDSERGAGTGTTGAVGITVRGLSHRYSTGDGPLTVLDGIDLDVRAGEFVAITGASGAGKTTLLSLIGGLDSLQQGMIVVGADDLSGLNRDALARYRRRTVGFVFQDYGLLEMLTAQENVELALAVAGVRRGTRRRRADELLDAVGLQSRSGHRPAALSGGERQRVAIARALANRPRLVLADEPTGNLDDTATERVLALMRSLPVEHACTVLTVTHNARVAGAADREVRLAGGRLVAVP
jgi:ABC-type lipoprotein export system ATPase subunit